MGTLKRIVVTGFVIAGLLSIAHFGRDTTSNQEYARMADESLHTHFETALRLNPDVLATDKGRELLQTYSNISGTLKNLIRIEHDLKVALNTHAQQKDIAKMNNLLYHLQKEMGQLSGHFTELDFIARHRGQDKSFMEAAQFQEITTQVKSCDVFANIRLDCECIVKVPDAFDNDTVNMARFLDSTLARVQTFHFNFF